MIGYAHWRLKGRPVAVQSLEPTINQWRSVFGGMVPEDDPVSEPLTCVLLCFSFTSEDIERTIRLQLAQTDKSWRMVLLVPHTDALAVAGVIQAVAPTDPRFIVRSWETHGGPSIAAHVDAIVEAEVGSHVVLIRSGTGLYSSAIAWFRFCLQDADLVYADDISVSRGRDSAIFKPDWSPTLALVSDYVGSVLVVRRTSLQGIGGYGKGISDITRRFACCDVRVCHLPNLLVERFGGIAPSYDDSQVHVEDRRVPFSWHRDVPLRVKIVIPTRNRGDLLRRAVDSVLLAEGVPHLELVIVDNGSSDVATLEYLESVRSIHRNVSTVRDGLPFNFSRVCNTGASFGPPSDVVVFLNNDVWTTDRRWLQQLVGWFDKPRVGAVGPMLLFPDGKIQHMAVVVGADSPSIPMTAQEPVPLATHIGRGLSRDAVAGTIFDAQREVAALTAACLAVRTEAFFRAGGFDDELAVDFQDVDLCLRLGLDQGLSLIYDPTVIMEHEESASRGLRGSSSGDTLSKMSKRWAAALKDGDPFFNAHLATDFSMRPVFGVDPVNLAARVAPRLSARGFRH